MRQKRIADDQVLTFCTAPRTVKELAIKFALTNSQVNKMMSDLLNKALVIMKKKASDGALRNVYVNVLTAEKFDFGKTVYATETLPAHDPFGIAKGARNAR